MAETKGRPDQPDAQMLQQMALQLARTQSTMTLATAASDSPWAAPVYFVYTLSAFYFFSAPDSRHIQEALAANQAAAAIFMDSFSYREICGIQMSGQIQPVPMGGEAIKVLKKYLDKFAFVKEMVDFGTELDLSVFSRKFSVKLYAFSPRRIYYSDNRLGFGFRKELPESLLNQR